MENSTITPVEEVVVDNKILDSVVEEIKYTFDKDILVKPLAPIMVTKEVTEAFGTGELDIDGYEKMDTKTETKEVESEYSKGIILALPSSLDNIEEKYKPKCKVGDVIVYSKKTAKWFDLYRDSQLVRTYDIIAICK